MTTRHEANASASRLVTMIMVRDQISKWPQSKKPCIVPPNLSALKPEDVLWPQSQCQEALFPGMGWFLFILHIFLKVFLIWLWFKVACTFLIPHPEESTQIMKLNSLPLAFRKETGTRGGGKEGGHWQRSVRSKETLKMPGSYLNLFTFSLHNILQGWEVWHHL